MKYDLFISYSRKDFDEVNALKMFIEESIQGIKVWFDIDGIESGEEFEEKIIVAIENSSCLLFVLSENSIASQWTKDEVMYAKNLSKKIIPVRLNNTELKGWFLFRFGRIDIIDFSDVIQQEKLVKNLSDFLQKPIIEKKTGENFIEDIKTSHLDNKVQGVFSRLKEDLEDAERLTTEGLEYFDKEEYTTALELLMKAANIGNVEAQYTIARMYANGYGIKEDIYKAIPWMTKAAEQGHIEAQNTLGRWYSLAASSNKLERNNDESLKWFIKAAEQGDKDSCFFAGLHYECGTVAGGKNLKEAKRWYKKGAAMGSDACIKQLNQTKFYFV